MQPKYEGKSRTDLEYLGHRTWGVFHKFILMLIIKELLISSHYMEVTHKLATYKQLSWPMIVKQPPGGMKLSLKAGSAVECTLGHFSVIA